MKNKEEKGGKIKKIKKKKKTDTDRDKETERARDTEIKKRQIEGIRKNVDAVIDKFGKKVMSEPVFFITIVIQWKNYFKMLTE